MQMGDSLFSGCVHGLFYDYGVQPEGCLSRQQSAARGVVFFFWLLYSGRNLDMMSMPAMLYNDMCSCSANDSPCGKVS